MEPPDYIDLNRAFVPYDADEPEQDLQSIELADQLGSDQRLRWSDLEQSSRVVILGEARSGKSEELKRQAERLRKIGHLAFTMTVEDLHDHGLQVAMMDKGDDGLARWRGKGGNAHLFVDSIDEARLTGVRLDSALRHILRSLSPDELERARIVLSCRYTDWRALEDLQAVRELLVAKEVHVVVLHGLDWAQIQTFVQTRGSRNAEGLIDQLRTTGAVAFARRPGDLAWIVDYWNTHERIASLTELIEDAVERFLREESPNQHPTLAGHRVRRAVEQLAGAMTIGRWNQLDHPIDGAGINTQGRLVPTRVLRDLKPPQLREVLTLRIFDPATLGRTRFRHRTIREYLAAQWLDSLCREGLGVAQLERLIFATRENRTIARPSLAPVAAWLAPKHDRIAEALLESSPRSLIVDGDPAGIPDELRVRVLLAHAHRYSDRRRLSDSFDGADLRRFASPALAPTINKLLNTNGPEQLHALLLRLARHGRIIGCRAAASCIAMDPARSAYLRSHAIEAIGKIGLLREQEAVVEYYSHTSHIDEEVLEALIEALYPNALDGPALISVLRIFVSDSRILPKGHLWFRLFWVLCRRKEGLPQVIEQLRSLVDERSSASAMADAHDEFVYRLYDSALAAFADLWRLGDETTVLEHAIRGAAGPLGARFRHYGRLSRLSERLENHPELRRTLFEHMLTSQDGEDSRAAFYRVCRPDSRDAQWLVELARSGGSTRLREAALLTLLHHSSIHDLDLNALRHLVYDVPDIVKHVDERLERRARAADSNAQAERQREQEAEGERHAREEFVTRLRSRVNEIRSGKALDDLWRIYLETKQYHTNSSATLESTLAEQFGLEIASAAIEGFRATWRFIDHDRIDSDPHDLMRELVWTGLELEVRDGLDLGMLNGELAQRATSIALKGTHLPPPWLDALAQAHPDAVRSAIDQLKNEKWLLSRLCHAPNAVRRLCADTFWAAAEQSHDAQALREVLRALYAVGEDHPRLQEICVRACQHELRPKHWGIWWALWFRLDPGEAISGLEGVTTVHGNERNEQTAWAAALLWTEPGALPTDSGVLERLWSFFEEHVPKEILEAKSRDRRRVVIYTALDRVIDAISNVELPGGLEVLRRLAQKFPRKRDWLLDRVDRRLADEAEVQRSPLVAQLLDACERHGLELFERARGIFTTEELSSPEGPSRRTALPRTEEPVEEVSDERLTDELAKVFWDLDRARDVAIDAGFDSGSVHVMKIPRVFWSRIVEDARNGAIPGRVQAVADAAARAFRDNPIFRRYRGV